MIKSQPSSSSINTQPNNQYQQMNSTQRRNQNMGNNCGVCGRRGHWESQCRQRNTNGGCFVCGDMNHRCRNCPQSKRRRRRDDNNNQGYHSQQTCWYPQSNHSIHPNFVPQYSMQSPPPQMIFQHTCPIIPIMGEHLQL